MPARRSADPLVPMHVRVPASLRNALAALAAAANITLSDALRAHLSLDAAKPLGNPVPRRRPPAQLGRVSRVDPEFLRQIAAIGSNLNQIARAANAAAAQAAPLQVMELLTLLRAIETKVDGMTVLDLRGDGTGGAH